MNKTPKYQNCSYFQPQGEGCLISLLNNGFIAKCIKRDSCWDMEEKTENDDNSNNSR